MKLITIFTILMIIFQVLMGVYFYFNQSLSFGSVFMPLIVWCVLIATYFIIKGIKSFMTWMWEF